MLDVKTEDLSEECNFNDEDETNNCFGCSHFLFPIGCMFFEKSNEDDNGYE